MKTVADHFVETPGVAGVKRIHGIAGDSLNGLTDAMRRQCVRVRPEEVATFAAGTEARPTDDLAVRPGSCGPENLHVINGLLDCSRACVPLLPIAAGITLAKTNLWR